eukprot:TRINITY_DN1859_c1_g1_i2.p1 TRINITY_DN1859_c1_g1~~TRINITY_DN1859_c1_g1_i2.p1  ORF type:complete len:1122 (-),score=340.89 TRINITY_DN1859_c1_g1_i2:94-2991(-)
MIARTEHTKWSKSFSIDSTGTNGVVVLPHEDGKHVVELGVALHLARGEYRLTKMIEFHPRFMVFNECSHVILAKQSGSEEVFRLEPGQGRPFYKFINNGTPKQLSINLDNKACVWSGPFSLEQLDDFAVKILEEPNKTAFLIRTVVTQKDATVVIKFSKQPEEIPPYLIENDTDIPFKFCQKKPKNGAVMVQTLEARKKAVYTWDLPSEPHILEVQMGNYKEEFKLDAIESYDPIKMNGKLIYIYTHAQAASKIFCMTENKSKLLDETTSAESEEKAKQATEIVKFDFKVRIKALGLSIIDSDPKELLYVWAEDLRVSFSESNLTQNAEIILNTFQVDNQMITTPFPVLLSQTDEESHPFAHFSVVKSMENLTLDYFTYFALRVQEITVAVDDTFIQECIKFGKNLPLAPFTHKNLGPPIPHYGMTITSTCLEEGCKSYPAGTYFFTYCLYPGKMAPITRFNAREPFSSITFTNLKPMEGYTKFFFMSKDDEKYYRIDTLYYESGKNNDVLQRYTTSLPEYDESAQFYPFDGNRETIEDTAAVNARQMFFKVFELNPIALNATFMISSNDNKYTDSPLRIVQHLLGTTLGNLDNAPLRLNALIMEDAFLKQDELVARMISHYKRQAFTEIYVVLGSADFLGNPVGLFNNVGTGVKDFFFEPAQGLVKSPQAFGLGLAKGSVSLAKHTTYGLFNTVSKITGTAGKGLAALSLDDDYVRRRQKDAIKEKPQHIGEGLMYGAKGLGVGLFDGVTGLVTQPVKGAQKEGIFGFAKGIGKGIIGVGLKPVVGVTDLVTKTTEGIRNTTTIFDKDKTRRRPPRFIEANKAISGYSDRESQGVYLLKTMKDGKYKDEKYVFHEEIEDGKMAIITENALFMVESNGRIDWMVSHKHIIEIDLAKQGIVIKFDKEPEIAIIASHDKDRTLVLYTKLGACIKSWYERHPNEQKKPSAPGKEGSADSTASPFVPKK